jgi:very-short-patch-repair endonuclease
MNPNVTRVPYRADGSRISTKCERGSYAKQMRANPTPAEQIMADRLDAASFNWGWQKPLGTYIVDFVIRDRCAVIEVDGGYHDTETQQWRDRRRDQILRLAGFTVFRIRNEDAASWPLSYVLDLRRTTMHQWSRACETAHQICRKELKEKGLHTSPKERRKIRAHFGLPESSAISQEQVLEWRSASNSGRERPGAQTGTHR